jgi:hypothetical protein
MGGQKEIADRPSRWLPLMFLPNRFSATKFHRSKLVIARTIWTAATCRRFPLLWRSHFLRPAAPQGKSGSAANESCDKSQHSKCRALSMSQLVQSVRWSTAFKCRPA